MTLFRHCFYCDSVINRKHFLCNECASKLRAAEFDSFMKRCKQCGFPLVSEEYKCKNCLLHPYSRVFSVYNYNNSFARRFLELYKFERHKEFAKFFADVLSLYIEDDEIIVPIPSSVSSIKSREWDQMLEITKFLDNKCYPIIQNNSNYEFQTKKMDKKARQFLAVNKFVLSSTDKFPPSDSKIVILDDVFTTGSTVFSAWKLLKDNSYENVRIITLYAEI